jgi:CxxC motif-containing protein (DUF1111 family)
MRQDGTVVGVRHVVIPEAGELGANRLNGIAVASDAQHIYLTGSGASGQDGSASGAILEVPAFGGATVGAAPSLIARGAAAFGHSFDPADGLGPLYNERSCVACHLSPSPGGMGRDGLATVRRVGRIAAGAFDPLLGQGGPIARTHSVAELGSHCDLQAGVPAAANLISIRNAPALYDAAAIEAVADEDIARGAVSYADGVHGRPNWATTADGTRRIGRFGWKADTPDLEQFVADAFRNEMGVTSPVAPADLISSSHGRGDRCEGESNTPKADRGLIAAVAAYVASLRPPGTSTCRPANPSGERLFSGLGCAECHATPFRAANAREPLYSDLLLHDMGPSLDDGVTQESARGRDWRTAPLMGLGSRIRFLHDGRAASIAEAILDHDGEGARASAAFRKLNGGDRHALIAYLASL